MVERKNLLRPEYYNHNPFTGSEAGMRFRIEKKEEEGEAFLLATIYPEPYAFDHTPDDQKESRQFPFSTEGLDQITEWLNETAGRFS